MIKSVLFFLYALLVMQVISCGGFKSTGNIPNLDQNPGGPQTTPSPSVSVTPTPPILPTPSQTPMPPPPGGPIECAALGGRFSTNQQIINYADLRGDTNSCIKVNDQPIRLGFGPCITCYEDGWVPPSPTPTPATPTPTGTPWPSPTPPGGGGGSGDSGGH